MEFLIVEPEDPDVIPPLIRTLQAEVFLNVHSGAQLQKRGCESKSTS